MQVLNYTPGAKATLFLEITDGYSHVRMDAVGTPYVSSILLPDFTNDGYDGYMLPLIHLDTGLYAFQYSIPNGAASVGSYLISVSYIHPVHGTNSSATYSLNVSAPYGRYNGTIITT